MKINTSTLLTLLSTKIDKPTKQTIEKLNIDGKIDVSSLLKEKSVQTLLDDLFKDLSNGAKNKNSVNQLLTSNKQLFDFKNLSSEVKNLFTIIKQNPKLEKQSAVLKEFLINIKNLDENNLKTNIKNSGVFLESKLSKIDIQNHNNIFNNKSTISTDLKAAILQIQEQIDTKAIELPKEAKNQLDKIQTQIEFYQLISYCSESNHTFLPFSWEDLEDANIKFDSKTKDEFSCQINLCLKRRGELKILLQLDTKNNLNLNIGIESQEFKELIQNNLQKLRVRLNKVGLMVQSLNIFDIQNKNNKTYEQNAYEANKLDFGLDIKI